MKSWQYSEQRSKKGMNSWRNVEVKSEEGQRGGGGG